MIELYKKYIAVYTKESDRQEFTIDEWHQFSYLMWINSKDITLHRNDGPAIEHINGNYKSWYMEGKRHRTNGPAIEDITVAAKWHIEGVMYTEKEFDKLIKEVRNMHPALRLTDPRWWVREWKDE